MTQDLRFLISLASNNDFNNFRVNLGHALTNQIFHNTQARAY